MEVTEAINTFKKQLIIFDNETYQEAVKLSRQKLKLLAECVEWCSNHISDLNIEMFVTDGMLEHFLDRLKDDQTELKKLGIIDPVKMAELLSIDLNELIKLEDKFNKCEGLIRFNKGKAMENVNEESYKIYTIDEADNNRLKHAKNIIKVLDNAIQDNISINTNYVNSATGGLVHWWHYGERGFRYNYSAFRR
jgi:hypothetical protein